MFYLHSPVSVSFTNKIRSKKYLSNDLVCTAIARAAKEERNVVINCCQHRCAGGSYFACGKKMNFENISQTYTKKEQVFQNKKRAHDFLNKVRQNPKKSKYICFEPRLNLDADVLLFFMNPSQVGKILGLSAYKDEIEIDIIPAISTCSSVFRPLLSPNTIHINFIDYFERELQAREFFEKEELLLSMTPEVFQKIIEAQKKSPHGDFLPHNIEIFPIQTLLTHLK